MLIISRNRYQICRLRMMVSSRSCAPPDLAILLGMCTRSAAYTTKPEPASNAALNNLVLKTQFGRGKHRRNFLNFDESAAKQKLNDILERSNNDGERSAWWLYNRAMLDSSVGDDQQAQKEFREALLAPDHLMAYHLTRLAVSSNP